MCFSVPTSLVERDEEEQEEEEEEAEEEEVVREPEPVKPGPEEDQTLRSLEDGVEGLPTTEPAATAQELPEPYELFNSDLADLNAEPSPLKTQLPAETLTKGFMPTHIFLLQVRIGAI
ncbi:unnamed protein product [Protopolystoma xenopodis]|uniref:Uncharacterized protein n=1 Tax=Protopolystoma xenopodis TaxID=117903 RepID=A0A448WF01_9PLAT|nr:unnamed protein product [Protopolystoma xenopodis]